MSTPDHAPAGRVRPLLTHPRRVYGLLTICLIVLTSCSSGGTGPRTDGPVATTTLPATLPLPGTAFPARGSSLGCAARSVAEFVYEDPAGKYCLVQPSETGVYHLPESDRFPSVTFSYPPAPEGQPEPRSIFLTLQDRGPLTGTLEAAVDADQSTLSPTDRADLKRGAETVAGVNAIVLDGYPGPSSGRVAYFAQKGRLYYLYLQPWLDAEMTDLQPKADKMWKTMAESLKFAP